MRTLIIGSNGSDVSRLQLALRDHGSDPGPIDGVFGLATQSAVIAFQRNSGLSPDGVVGTRTAAALGLIDAAPALSVLPSLTVEVVSTMFPGAPHGNIERHLPIVLEALVAAALTAKPMVLMSLATIRAETADFVPIEELPNQFNTSPGGRPFDRYDKRADLGNLGPPAGERYRGRGFIQLTGRANYEKHGTSIGVPDLVMTPERANEPEIAAQLLVSFIKSNEQNIKDALLADDLPTARRLVNGGRHGIDGFTDAYRTGQRLI